MTIIDALPLNWVVFWKLLNNLIQSAGNLISLDFLEILRDYTLKFIDCMICVTVPLQQNNHYYQIQDDWFDQNKINPEFTYYLAGLIEGDGSIIVPKTERSKKGKLNYPSIQIAFDSRDLVLALIIQKSLGFGSISKTKGVNAYRFTVNNYQGLIQMVRILNGKFKTVKIQDFNLLIDFFK